MSPLLLLGSALAFQLRAPPLNVASRRASGSVVMAADADAVRSALADLQAQQSKLNALLATMDAPVPAPAPVAVPTPPVAVPTPPPVVPESVMPPAPVVPSMPDKVRELEAQLEMLQSSGERSKSAALDLADQEKKAALERQKATLESQFETQKAQAIAAAVAELRTTLESTADVKVKAFEAQAEGRHQTALNELRNQLAVQAAADRTATVEPRRVVTFDAAPPVRRASAARRCARSNERCGRTRRRRRRA